MRHLGIKQLWLQQEEQQKCFEVVHVSGRQNIADGFTKPLSGPKHVEFAQQLGLKDIVTPAMEPTIAMLQGPRLRVELQQPKCSCGCYCQGQFAADGCFSWFCDCGKQMTWQQYTHENGQVEMNYLGAVEQNRTNIAQSSSMATMTSPTVMNVYVGSMDTPPWPVSSQPVLTPRPSSCTGEVTVSGGVTERQRDYIILLAERRGLDVEQVLSQATSRVRASRIIDLLKANRYVPNHPL